MNRTPGNHRTTRLLGAAFALVALTGCAYWPWRETDNPVAPPEVVADTTGQARASAPPDSMNRGPIGTPPILGSETRSKPAETKEKPVAQGPGAAPADTIKAVEQPPLSVSVAMTEKEREQLRTVCIGDLAAAELIINRLSPRANGTASRQEIETVRGFVTQSRAALESDDIRAAATLAHKARVLAEDMASRATP